MRSLLEAHCLVCPPQTDCAQWVLTHVISLSIFGPDSLVILAMIEKGCKCNLASVSMATDLSDKALLMNSMKLVIPLHSLYWSIHTKDESKRGTTFAFIFGVN